MINLLVIILLIILIIYGVYLLNKNKNEKFETTYPTKIGIEKKLYLNPPGPPIITDKLGIERNKVTVKFQCDKGVCNLIEPFDPSVSPSPSPSLSPSASVSSPPSTSIFASLNKDDEIEEYINSINNFKNSINSNVNNIKANLVKYFNDYNESIKLINKNLDFQNNEINNLKNKINYKDNFENVPLPTIKINQNQLNDKLNFISIE